MQYFQLHENIVRNHPGAKTIFFKVDGETLIESVVIGRNSKSLWALIEECQQKFDFSGCNAISKNKYYSHYEDANYIITQ